MRRNRAESVLQGRIRTRNVIAKKSRRHFGCSAEHRAAFAPVPTLCFSGSWRRLDILIRRDFRNKHLIFGFESIEKLAVSTLQLVKPTPEYHRLMHDRSSPTQFVVSLETRSRQACRFSTGWIVRPVFGYVELAIEDGRKSRRRISQVATYSAVFDIPAIAVVLTSYRCGRGITLGCS